MEKRFDKLMRERPEALDAADTPQKRKLAAAYLLDVLPAHVHERLAQKAPRATQKSATKLVRIETMRVPINGPLASNAASRRMRQQAERRLDAVAAREMTAATREE